MEFEMVTAVQTPFPPPDMSSPNRSFENLSFIISSSEKHPQNQPNYHQFLRIRKIEFSQTPKEEFL